MVMPNAELEIEKPPRKAGGTDDPIGPPRPVPSSSGREARWVILVFSSDLVTLMMMKEKRSSPFRLSPMVAVALAKSEHHLDLLGGLGQRWAEQDAGAARNWVESLSDPVLHQRALAGVLEVWARSDPSGAAHYASEVENDAARFEALEIAARHWAEQDARAALDWALFLSGDESRHARGTVLLELAGQDPGRSASLFKALLPDGYLDDREESQFYRETGREIAERWARVDPEAAAAWASAFPETSVPGNMPLRGVAESWYHVDPEAAEKWASQLPRGSKRDHAVGTVIDETVESNPAKAFALAELFSDPGYQTLYMGQALRRWGTTDPEAARSAFESVDLPAEQRKELESYWKR